MGGAGGVEERKVLILGGGCGVEREVFEDEEKSEGEKGKSYDFYEC